MDHKGFASTVTIAVMLLLFGVIFYLVVIRDEEREQTLRENVFVSDESSPIAPIIGDAGPKNIASWQTYRDANLRFSMDIPPEFSFSGRSDNGVKFAHKDIRDYEINVEKYACGAYSLEVYIDAHIFGGDSVRSFKESIANDEVGRFSAVEEVTVDGQKGYSFTWFTEGDGARLVLVPDHSREYVYNISVSFLFTNTEFSREEVALESEIISRMIKGFQILK